MVVAVVVLILLLMVIAVNVKITATKVINYVHEGKFTKVAHVITISTKNLR